MKHKKSWLNFYSLTSKKRVALTRCRKKMATLWCFRALLPTCEADDEFLFESYFLNSCLQGCQSGRDVSGEWMLRLLGVTEWVTSGTPELCFTSSAASRRQEGNCSNQLDLSRISVKLYFQQLLLLRSALFQPKTWSVRLAMLGLVVQAMQCKN